LHIGIVTETYPPEVNGVAMTTGRLIDGLMRMGHVVDLIRPRQGRGDRPRRAHAMKETLVPGVPLPRYAGLRVGLPAARVLRRLWSEQRPDIVHVVTEGPLGYCAVRVARALGIPVSSSFHTNFHSYSRHYGVGLLQPAVAGYLRRFHNRTACTFVATHQLETQLSRAGFERLRVVARGVDTELFSPARRSEGLRREWAASPKTVVALYVGRLAAEKNLPVVFGAFDELRRAAPDSRLVLVGDGPQRADLQASHPEHMFAGLRRGEDLATHYASADVFLFPSLTETFGNVTLEAMASGLAVVAYDYAAAREHIRHRLSGMLAPFGEGDAFGALAAELGSDGRLREKLRQNARAAACAVRWDTVVEGLARTMEEIAGQGEGAFG
jgi:glycosyltransferase involved in cell wall biosynthesis